MTPIISLLLKELVASSFFFSYSERFACVPNWQQYPTDYEWRFGFRTKNFASIWLWERETGHKGYGRENKYLFKVKDFSIEDEKIGSWKLGGNDYVRSIWDINYQEQYCIFESTIPNWNISAGAGISYFWENDFRNPKTCVKTTLSLHKIIDLKFSQETNFGDRCYKSLYIGKKFLIDVPYLSDIFDLRFEIYAKRHWKEGKLTALQNRGEVDIELLLKEWVR